MTTQYLADENQTQQAGNRLAQQLRAGDFVWLEGPLGAGKTTFSQGLAQGLGIAAPISSPTFVFINEYAGKLPLLHLDAYRMENFDWDALRDAGLEDFLERDEAVRLVEWPSLIKMWLPSPRFVVRLQIEDAGRVLTIEEQSQFTT